MRTSITAIVCLAAAISQAAPITPDVAEAAALADLMQPISDRQVRQNETWTRDVDMELDLVEKRQPMEGVLDLDLVEPTTQPAEDDSGSSEYWFARAVGVLARTLHLDTRQAANKTSLSVEASRANQPVLPSVAAPTSRAVGEDVNSIALQLDLEAREDNRTRIMADLPRATMSAEDDMAELPLLLDS